MVTLTRQVRRYEYDEKAQVLSKRDALLPAQLRVSVTCKHCGEEIMASVGQIVSSHKQCRKEYRETLRKLKNG